MKYTVHGRKMDSMAKRVPPTRFPDVVAASYFRSIDKLVQEAGKATLSLYDTAVKSEMQKDGRGYVQDGPFDFFKRLTSHIKKVVSIVYSQQRVNKAASSFMKNLNQVNKTNMEQQGRVRGIELTATESWLAPFMKENIQKNVDYITNIRDEYTHKIESIIYEGIKDGSSYKTIREQLEEQIGMSQRRAKFIAVDQSGTLFGQMTAQRHQNMGVMKFKWRTSKDERVRDSHVILEDKIFSYDDPPSVGLPGEDFRCRCIALPIFED